VTECDLHKCVMMFYYMHQNCGQDFNFCPLGSSSTYVGFTQYYFDGSINRTYMTEPSI